MNSDNIFINYAKQLAALSAIEHEPILLKFETIDGRIKFDEQFTVGSAICDIKCYIARRFEKDGIIINPHNINIIHNEINLIEGNRLFDYGIKEIALIKIIPTIATSIRREKINSMNLDAIKEFNYQINSCESFKLTDEEMAKLMQSDNTGETAVEQKPPESDTNHEFKVCQKQINIVKNNLKKLPNTTKKEIKMKAKECLKHGIKGLIVDKNGNVRLLREQQYNAIKHLDKLTDLPIVKEIADSNKLALFNTMYERVKKNLGMEDEKDTLMADDEEEAIVDTNMTDKIHELKIKMEEEKTKRNEALARANEKL